jgi:hypothetical protein
MTLIPLNDAGKVRDVRETPKEGEVVYNDDPLRMQRIKVAIKGIYEGSDFNNLPWVCKAQPAFLGGGPDAGFCSVPILGAKVEVFWPFGDLSMPYYRDVFVTITTTPDEFKEDYPSCYGFKDDAGLLVKVNKATEVITVENRNMSIVLDSDGQVTFSTPKLMVDGMLSTTAGATGTFVTADYKTVTVIDGIIYQIY